MLCYPRHRSVGFQGRTEMRNGILIPFLDKPNPSQSALSEVTMSLRPCAIEPIPQQTIRVACAAFPKGNTYMKMRDELGVFYDDELFIEMFPSSFNLHSLRGDWRW